MRYRGGLANAAWEGMELQHYDDTPVGDHHILTSVRPPTAVRRHTPFPTTSGGDLQQRAAKGVPGVDVVAEAVRIGQAAARWRRLLVLNVGGASSQLCLA